MKRSKELETLSWEHHDGLVIAARIKNDLKKEAEPTHLIPYITDIYTNYLRHHFKQEEDSFLTPVKPFSEADILIKRMLDEHQQFAEIFAQIDPLDSEVFVYVGRFGELLHDHIRFEERQLFPLIEELLSAEQLKEIERYLRREHKPIPRECKI